ncbi:acyl-CoA dehydrogenase family protein [Sinisalibacter aestuarii]|uniref:Acyl-CoA dehydrogenase n=1 Tax=Sinisalibacter aestuarii TaxID=2949426 RepID=A0ABQ5LZS1_9RHOB|nr:acyl-CoA dehydrogenase family protein [Sinisalibacter aestuarii]GKY89965.1 hypothetical protein STA1M1_38340 [Sinisalibacter aestuarii]
MTCDLNRTEDQRQILDAAEAMLQAAYPVSRLQDGGPDDLAEIAAFGAYALALPEERGGTGFSLVEEALLHSLFGRALISTNALAAALAARLAPDEIADAIIDGSMSVCCALPNRGRAMLIDGAAAELALIFDGDTLRLARIADTAQTPADGLGHGLAISFTDPVHEIAASDAAQPRATADVLISAQLLGGAEAARDLAVDYAMVRQQFGKPIGAFQAIKHHCANMAIGAEMVSAQLDMAAIALRDGRADAAFQAAALRRLAGRVALDNARICIQVHGGIGFSAEAPAHHYVKRAHLLRRLGQAPDFLALAAALPPLTPPNEAHHAPS